MRFVPILIRAQHPVAYLGITVKYTVLGMHEPLPQQCRCGIGMGMAYHAWSHLDPARILKCRSLGTFPDKQHRQMSGIDPGVPSNLHPLWGVRVLLFTSLFTYFSSCGLDCF